MTILSFYSFDIGPHNVVRLARGYSESKFSAVVIVKIPLWFFVGGTADQSLHTVDRVVIRAPDRTKNECVGICGLQFLGRGAGNGHGGKTWSTADERQEKKETTERRQTKAAGARRRHRLRPQLPLLLPRNPLPPPLTPAD